MTHAPYTEDTSSQIPALLSHLGRLPKLLKMTPGTRVRIEGKLFVDQIQEAEEAEVE